MKTPRLKIIGVNEEPEWAAYGASKIATSTIRDWTIFYDAHGSGAARGPDRRAAHHGRSTPFSSFTHYGDGRFGFDRPEVVPQYVRAQMRRDVAQLKKRGWLEAR